MLNVINPATEEIYEVLEETSASDLDTCYERSKKAQKKWSSSSFSERKEILNRFNQALLQEKENCAKILSQEMGKPYLQAIGELENTAQRVQWFLDHCENELETKTTFSGKGVTEKISWDPLGVVLNISAWNFPYFIGTNVIIPALLTGNSVLYKPSEICPLTGLRIRSLLLKSGLDEDLFQVLVGRGDLGRKLLELPVDGVFFTGSHRTGQKIAQQTGGRFIKTVLELGGKDPAYVMADAKVETVAQNLVDGAFYNAGQSCCSVERIYIHESLYESFVESFVEQTKKLVIGDPFHEKTYMGPLARFEQINFLNRQGDEAKKKGAQEIFVGGSKEDKGYFYNPRVFTNVNHGMLLMKEESFGPTIGLMKVKNNEEALELMNDTDYGLTASLHGNNFEQGQKLMSQLQTGTVYFNLCDRVSPFVPWSGRKSSGMGATLSTLGVKEFLRPKAWQIKV